MIPFEEALGETLAKLGLAEPALMIDLEREWSAVAGEPWVSKSTPLYLKGGVLVVEATEASAVAFLRYGVAELQERLGERFGAETVSSVEIRSPQRGRRR